MMFDFFYDMKWDVVQCRKKLCIFNISALHVYSFMGVLIYVYCFIGVMCDRCTVYKNVDKLFVNGLD